MGFDFISYWSFPFYSLFFLLSFWIAQSRQHCFIMDFSTVISILMLLFKFSYFKV